MRKSSLAIATILGVLVLASAAQASTKKPSGAVTLAEMKLTVTVESVDVAKRLVTLKAPDGTTETFEVDPIVKNLPQLKKGDVITILYKESVAWELRKHGPAQARVADNVELQTRKLGEKPGVGAARTINATVTITKIDANAPSITVQAPGGGEHTVKVADPKKLAGVKVGDQIDLTYTEAVIVAAEELKKK